MIFLQYKETCEVLIDYPKMGGCYIKYYVKRVVRNLLRANINFHSRRLISEFSGDGVKLISKLQSHCANMTFSDKSRYDRIFWQVTHKGGYSEINYINIFQNVQALSISVGKSYSEDQLMHICLNKFRQDGKCSTQIAIPQAELKREESLLTKNLLSIKYLQTDYLNIDISSGSVRNNDRENNV